jgi:8-oxo-dGTP diphosphatase
VEAAPVHVVAGAILDGGRVLLVSKRAAPSVFYLPGGKPDPGEEPAATLARELAEELGVALIHSEPLAVVSDQAALEPARLEMEVHLATVDGPVAPRAEIAAIAWVGAQGGSPGVLAPAIRNHVLPRLTALGLAA